MVYEKIDRFLKHKGPVLTHEEYNELTDMIIDSFISIMPDKTNSDSEYDYYSVRCDNGKSFSFMVERKHNV